MESINICVPIIAAILGVAYPLLLQVITNLETKYSSPKIVQLFNSEWEKKWFRYFLIISLFFVLIWIIGFPSPEINLGWFNKVVNNSAEILVVISTGLLVTFFLNLVRKVMKYYSVGNLTKYIISQKNIKDDENLFRALTDIFLYSIKSQNEPIAETISRFLYTAFNEVRLKDATEENGFPTYYYDLVYQASRELVITPNNRLNFIDARTVGGIWLLGEWQHKKIHKTTYQFLWLNLRFAIENRNENMVMSFWRHAHQYYSYVLNSIDDEYDEETGDIINQSVIDQRNKEREEFINFTYALGGLLLYSGMYNCLERALKYSTSEPPQYKLLPKTIDEIIAQYLKFYDPFDREFTFISSIFSFPEQDGLRADGIIKMWIRKYISLLYIRQFSLHSYYSTDNFITKPRIPVTRNIQRKWLDIFDIFEKQVSGILDDFELLKGTGFEHITKDWCESQTKPYPSDLLAEIKQDVQHAYEAAEVEQPISEVKRQQFYDTSNRILSTTINEYKRLNNANSIESDYTNQFFGGLRVITDKSTFADNQEADHLNFDSFLAESISGRFKSNFSAMFALKRKVTYLIEPDVIFKAIEKLSASEDFVIIYFGGYFEKFKNSDSNQKLLNGTFNENDIIKIPYYERQILDESFFIIHKSDLPYILHNEIDQEEREKYHLELVNDELRIFMNIVNFNEEDDLIELYSAQKSAEELRKSVLAYIAFNTEVRWKNDANMVQIKVYSPYHEKGLPNKLTDITPIKK